MNLFPDKQLFIDVPFQSTNFKMKEMCADKKVQESIGDVFCPTSTNEKCVYLSANKYSSLYDRKKCTACSHVLNVLFKDQK